MACNCRPLPCTRPPSLRTTTSSLAFFSQQRRRRVLDPPKLSLSSQFPSPESSPEGLDKRLEDAPDRVKLAFAKAAAYRKQKAEAAQAREALDSLKLATEKAGVSASGGDGNGSHAGGGIGPESQRIQSNSSSNSSGSSPKEGSANSDVSISSIDFMGPNFFGRKASTGPLPGLAPPADPFSLEDLPEVETIVEDVSKFGNASSTQGGSSVQDVDLDLYTPKVSSWGIFPRPRNFSKTYGGGRTIRPGDELETAEVKAAREAQGRQLMASYRKKLGLNIDPEKRVECEKALKDGDELMDKGRLLEALPYYEKVMNNLVFESELHGLAAFQWAICQDSLCRPGEARMIYEKLQQHPNNEVSRKAKQMVFTFQAMKVLKVSSSSTNITNYEPYFDAFVNNKTSYTVKKEHSDDTLKEILPYILFLLSPLFFVAAIAVGR